ncbi:hypothetical protein GpartN1_g7566.t1 [Galdieria partita]|uniref:Uncharacterized protein n=1 Tax=Galdieria partita TaxID=83374 RepID=A0A9C7UUU3_9RHOD|nr:hypothetical protein GpartN1_g7566.t1 [Galdieria partita]
MKIRSLNEQGEEEDEEELQNEELTRSCSELVFAYSLETPDCSTSMSDDDEAKSLAECWLQQQVGKTPDNTYARYCSESKDATLLFHCLPQETLAKQWLLNKLKLPTRTLHIFQKVSLASGIRRRKRNKSFGHQQNISKWLPLLRKISISEQYKDETREVVDKEERQVCELLSKVSLSHRRRKTVWTSHKAKTLGWAVTVSFP